MIKHIVLFKFKEDDKLNFMKEIKSELEALTDKIEELKKMEVGISFLNDPNMPDLSIYSVFENKEALKKYAEHPDHLKVVDKIKSMALSRSVVDYEN